jgi:hypothetical protein
MCAPHPLPRVQRAQVVAAWNGMAVGAYALASRALASEAPPQVAPLPLFPVEGSPARAYLAAAQRVAAFAHERLWDAGAARLRRSYCGGTPSAVAGACGDAAPGGAGVEVGVTRPPARPAARLAGQCPLI